MSCPLKIFEIKLIFSFVSVYFGKMIHGMRKKVAIRTDRRVLLMNELITGIRVIKMYTWEPVFKELIFLARK